MTSSILTSTKKALGVHENDESFDPDIIMHINSVFVILHQLGVGPPDGFMIEDKTPTWEEYLEGNPATNLVKSLMYLRVRLLFDPPGTSYLIEAMQKQAEEFEWRLNADREGVVYPWQPPVT